MKKVKKAKKLKTLPKSKTTTTSTIKDYSELRKSVPHGGTK